MAWVGAGRCGAPNDRGNTRSSCAPTNAISTLRRARPSGAATPSWGRPTWCGWATSPTSSLQSSQRRVGLSSRLGAPRRSRPTWRAAAPRGRRPVGRHAGSSTAAASSRCRPFSGQRRDLARAICSERRRRGSAGQPPEPRPHERVPPVRLPLERLLGPTPGHGRGAAPGRHPRCKWRRRELRVRGAVQGATRRDPGLLADVRDRRLRDRADRAGRVLEAQPAPAMGGHDALDRRQTLPQAPLPPPMDRGNCVKNGADRNARGRHRLDGGARRMRSPESVLGWVALGARRGASARTPLGHASAMALDLEQSRRPLGPRHERGAPHPRERHPDKARPAGSPLPMSARGGSKGTQQIRAPRGACGGVRTSVQRRP